MKVDLSPQELRLLNTAIANSATRQRGHVTYLAFHLGTTNKTTRDARKLVRVKDRLAAKIAEAEKASRAG